MDRTKIKTQRRNKIRRRIRAIVRGTAERPRLSIFKSNKHVYLQLIDDENGRTILAVTTDSKTMKEELSGKSRIERAAILGKMLAEGARERGLSKVVFDRSGYKYHGIVKAAAEGAREGGLDF